VKTLRIAIIASCFAATAWADDIPGLWKAKCASCHGEDGKAQTKTGKKEKINDMTTADFQTKFSDDAMRKVILEGSKDNNKMKPFKGKISDADVDGLIKHIRSFKG